MERKSLAIAGVSIFLSLCAITSVAQVSRSTSEQADKKDVSARIIVKYKVDASGRAAPSKLSSIAGVKAKNQKVLRGGVSVISLNGAAEAESAFEALSQSDAVEYVEYDVPIHAVQTPNDLSFSDLWGLLNTGQAGGLPDIDINADIAWDQTTGGDVVIGVVDSGIDYNHPDLAANVWVNEAELNGEPGVDDDGNGYVDDINGIDLVNGDSDPMDDNYHGTHVSGTIAAVGNNALGITGVNWNAKIVPCKSLNSGGSGWISDAVTCMDYFLALKESGVNIVVTNHSWAGPFVQAFNDVTALHNEAGILAVAAAGNSGRLVDEPDSAQDVFPAALQLDNVISVAAIDRNGNLADFSNYGKNSVHLAAPGVEILSTVPGGGYEMFNGTSMAAPHVAGVVALLNAAHPGMDHLQLKEFILNTGKPLGSLADTTITGKMLRIEFDDDYDSMPNNWELLYGLNPGSAADKELDADGDGLANYLEFKNKTNPLDADSDDDGLSDGDEVLGYFSDPNNPDSDGDGLSDKTEVDAGTSPLSEDIDGDGLNDTEELELGTSPYDPDSDGDGMDDGWEGGNNLNPLEDDSLLDGDGDGFENILEFKAGTRPDDPASAPEPGSYLWSEKLSGWLTGLSLGGNGELLVVEEGEYQTNESAWSPGNLIAFNQYGKILWRRSLGLDPDGVAVAHSRQPPLVTTNGDIYLAANGDVYETTRHVIQKYNSAGELLWQRSTCPVRSRALDNDGGLVVMCGSSTTVAFDERGEEKWRVQESHGPRPRVLVSGDTHTYRAVWGNIVKRNLSGELVWSVKAGDSSELYSPILGKEMIYIATRQYDTNATDQSPNLFGLGYEGELIWAVRLPENPSQPPVIDSDGNLYVATSDGTIYKYSAAGEQLWVKRITLNSLVGHMLIDSNNGLYIVAGYSDAVIGYLGDTDTDIRWSYPFNKIGFETTPILLPGKEILVMLGDRELIAIRHEGFNVSESEWPTYGGSFQHTNNLSIDVDGDGMDDNWEVRFGLQVGINDANLDLDDDGLDNIYEYLNGTAVNNSDSDEDGLSDGDEILVYKTKPLDADTDQDGLSDGEEVVDDLSDPLVVDTDGDGLSDYDEVAVHETSPRLIDTDGDSLSDYDEIELFNSDPRVFNEPFADVEIDLVGRDGSSPLDNGRIIYESVVGNRGAFPATNVVMTNTLPAGVTFESAVSDKVDCSYTFPVIRCEADALDAFDGFTVEVTVATEITDPLAFSAAVESEGPFDQNLFNNTAQRDFGGLPSCGCKPCEEGASTPDPTFPAMALLALGGVFRKKWRRADSNNHAH